MAQGGIKMPTLDWENEDQNYAFQEWKEFLASYFVIQNVAADQQWHYVLLSSGSKGRELWNTWALPADDKKNPVKVFERFEQHMVGSPNKWVQMLEFSAMKQKENEHVDDYIVRLRTKAAKCRLNDEMKDMMMTLQLIKGIPWDEERKKLISKGNDLTLDVAIKSAQAYQATTLNVDMYRAATGTQKTEKNVDAFLKKKIKNCTYCGKEHGPRNCPAYGKKCPKCGKYNHFESMCRTEVAGRPKNEVERKPQKFAKNKKSTKSDKKVAEVNRYESDTEEDDDTVYCGSVKKNQVTEVSSQSKPVSETRGERQHIMVNLEVKPPGVTKCVYLKIKADTGAECNILPLRCLKQMYPDCTNSQGRLKPGYIQPSSVQLEAANDLKMPHLGAIDMKIRLDKNEWYSYTFYVRDTTGPALLSCDASVKLGIVKLNTSKNVQSIERKEKTLIEESKQQETPIPDRETLQALYPDRFTGIGSMPGKYHITLKEDAVPHIAPRRKYPIQLRKDLVEKLGEMKELDVIEKVDDTESVDYLNSLACERKDTGELRVCMDPKFLNEAIKRTYHKTPTLEEISHKFNGSRVFSKLDAKHGYWSVHLDEESSKLCTFDSPAGKFRFKRLPFGLNVSQDIFQQKMDVIVSESGEGVLGIADDICIYGKDVESHDAALHRFMRAAQRHGLVLRLEKCYIRLWTMD